MKAYHHLLVCLLLKIAAMARADFLFEFEIVRHRTNGNCAGIDFTIPCETFVNDFCLRGPSYRGGARNYNRNTCPLGKNSQRVFETVPAQRTIQSTEPWPVNGVFQLYMGAHDDDYPFTTFDFLDNIFVDRSKTVSNVYSTVETIWGERNKVGVDIRFRVRCVQHFYRADCSQYCLARNDNINGHYTCNQEGGSKICNSGYEHPETNCVDLITACSLSPCERGTCSPIGLTEFTCSCPPGYTGMTCEMNIDECLNNTACLNEGNCTDLVADYSCSCVLGFTGKSCEIDINECLEVVCVGNATCVDGTNHYECVCNPGFEGQNCTEIDPCDGTPCAVTGECLSSSPFNYTCLCDSGYTGQHCEVNIDDCVTATCPEDSDCVDGVESYSCVCHAGFVGENCTSLGGVTLEGSAIGGAVGGLVAFILIILIIILIVAMVFAMARRRRSKREFIVPLNPYASSPVDDSPAHIINNSMYGQTDDPLVDNPLYTIRSTSPTPTPDQTTRRSPDFDMSSSLAYETARDINNPLYGVKSPERKVDPVYAELEGPPQGAASQPQKGSNNNPYSYALLEGNRRPTVGAQVAPPPEYEQIALDSTAKPNGRPQYEEVELKMFPNGRAQNAVAVHGYDVPNPLPSMLGDTITTDKEQGAKKKSIYDSDDDILMKASSRPSPPPRTQPPHSQQQDSSDVYSYAIVPDNARRSVKVKGDMEGTEFPPYNTLEHDLGSDVPANQIRLSKVEESGYEALKN